MTMTIIIGHYFHEITDLTKNFSARVARRVPPLPYWLHEPKSNQKLYFFRQILSFCSYYIIDASPQIQNWY